MLRLANEDDVELLTKMSKASFDTDKELYNINSGPTGYDSYEWHLNRYQKNELYVLEYDGKIYGCTVLVKNSEGIYIHRLFVDSHYFCYGYGLSLMKAIEDYFPECKVFRLDTPEWNDRTNSFYKKCGYKQVDKIETPDFLLNLYEKKK